MPGRSSSHETWLAACEPRRLTLPAGERRGAVMRIAIACAAVTAALSCIAAAPQSQPGASVDGARIAAADSDPGEWLSHGRTYSEERFSPLRQINTRNVKNLGVAWE